MKDQHKHIKGYRDLSPEEIELMNEGKILAEQVGEYITRLEAKESVDPCWLTMGKMDLQKGFMSVIRSIAKPTSF